MIFYPSVYQSQMVTNGIRIVKDRPIFSSDYLARHEAINQTGLKQM